MGGRCVTDRCPDNGPDLPPRRGSFWFPCEARPPPSPIPQRHSFLCPNCHVYGIYCWWWPDVKRPVYACDFQCDCWCDLSRIQNAPYPTRHGCFCAKESRRLQRTLSHISWGHSSIQFMLTWRVLAQSYTTKNPRGVGWSKFCAQNRIENRIKIHKCKRGSKHLFSSPFQWQSRQRQSLPPRKRAPRWLRTAVGHPLTQR